MKVGLHLRWWVGWVGGGVGVGAASFPSKLYPCSSFWQQLLSPIYLQGVPFGAFLDCNTV